MKTIYAACLSRLGLTQAEAAALHGARPDTVKNWAVGRRGVPQSAWDDLRGVEAAIVDRSEAMREIWEEQGSQPLEMDDIEGDAAMRMAAADLILTSEGPVFVGQTAATQAARQARRPN